MLIHGNRGTALALSLITRARDAATEIPAMIKLYTIDDGFHGSFATGRWAWTVRLDGSAEVASFPYQRGTMAAWSAAAAEAREYARARTREESDPEALATFLSREAARKPQWVVPG